MGRRKAGRNDYNNAIEKFRNSLDKYKYLYLLCIPVGPTKPDSRHFYNTLRGIGTVISGHNETLKRCLYRFLNDSGMLQPFVQDNANLFFSDLDKERVVELLGDFRFMGFPKPGRVASCTAIHGTGAIRKRLRGGAYRMSLECRRLGLETYVDNGRVIMLKPRTIFRKGDVLSREQCTMCWLLNIRSERLQVRIPWVWSIDEGTTKPLESCNSGKVIKNALVSINIRFPVQVKSEPEVIEVSEGE